MRGLRGLDRTVCAGRLKIKIAMRSECIKAGLKRYGSYFTCVSAGCLEMGEEAELSRDKCAEVRATGVPGMVFKEVSAWTPVELEAAIP